VAASLVPTSQRLPIALASADVREDGRPTGPFRAELRRIRSWRNASTVALLYAQTLGLVWLVVWWGNPIGHVGAFLLMGRAHAQFASLMHEAAHRLLFANRTANDLVGRWLLGYPSFTPTDAYRRRHMAHHRDPFGPEEPDLALYSGYPIPADSLRRKLWRDATGRTGWKLLKAQLATLRSDDRRSRRTTWKIIGVQAALFGTCIALGVWWVYPVFWLAPHLTVWRVINRLRSIAEHGGMARARDSRQTTHSVRQKPLAKFVLVPYQIGFHLAHHVDAGVPFRNLPTYHRALRDAGYVDDTLEYRDYLTLWRALGAGDGGRSTIDV